MLQAHPSVITSRDHCAQLLGHEASRVLHDRLTNDADRRYFYRVLSEQLRNGFKTRWSAEELEKRPLIFGDFLEGSEPHSPRVYRSVRQYDRLPQILEVGFALNPLTSRSKKKISPYNIHTLSRKQVIRILKIIRKGLLTCYSVFQLYYLVECNSSYLSKPFVISVNGLLQLN